jgi:hypothetical protein
MGSVRSHLWLPCKRPSSDSRTRLGTITLRQVDGGPLAVLQVLLEALGPFTGGQPVHSGIWEGWDFWYRTGSDPSMGTGVWVAWPEGTPQPPRAERERMLSEARLRAAKRRVEKPDAEPLRLPHLQYYLWTGPLHSALAFRQHPHAPPSLVWPADRSWFVGVPIYTNEIAIGGAPEIIAAVLADQGLHARPASPDDILDIDD